MSGSSGDGTLDSRSHSDHARTHGEVTEFFPLLPVSRERGEQQLECRQDAGFVRVLAEQVGCAPATALWTGRRFPFSPRHARSRPGTEVERMEYQENPLLVVLSGRK